MVSRTAFGVLATAVLLTACTRTPADVVIENVTVVSAERAAPLENAYVAIRAGRIDAVSARPLAGAQRIDGTGRYLIPGLIDTHVHLRSIPGMTREQEAAHPEIARAARAQIPRSYLHAGFTTVLDLAGDAGAIAQWNALEERPDAYSCGVAPIANGYPMHNIPEAVRFRVTDYFLYDERQQDRIPDWVDPAEHTPEAVVARMAGAGAVCVKTHHESGFGAMRNLPTPTVEMIRALVAAAHARGMTVFIHANKEAAQAFAVDAGVDVIAHGLWTWTDQTSNDMTGGVTAIADAVIENGIGYQPTIQVLYGELDLFDETYLARPGLADSVPALLLDWYAGAEGQWFRNELAAVYGGVPPAPEDAASLRRVRQVVAYLGAQDARLLFGSDTPSDLTYANFPGFNGRLEMDRWVAAGVTEAQLFRALTIANAESVGLDGEIGTIEPGKTAHLLLLTENPLERVEAYDTIETVFLAGRPIPRAGLSARATAQ